MNASAKYIFLVMTAFSVACTERIEIRLDKGFERLVVEGSITTERKAHEVKLSRTSDYFYNLPPEIVTGAQVTITDNSVRYTLIEKEPGIYRTADNLRGFPGHNYTLDILLKEPVGGYDQYKASSYMNDISPVDSIGLLFHSDWGEKGIWEVKCYVLDPPTADFYRFMVSRNNIPVTDTLNEWFVTDDKFFNGSYIFGAAIGFLDQGSPGESLKPGDLVTGEIHSLGKEYASFIQEAQSELFGSNPLFSGPPANVKGNISNGAFGFFAAYSVSRGYALVPGTP